MDDRRRCRHVCELHFVCALVIKLPSLKNTHTAHTQKNIFWFCRLMVRVSWVVTNAVNLSIFPAAVNAVISFHYTQTLFNVISFDAVLALAQTVCGRLFPSSTLPVHKVFLSFLFIYFFFYFCLLFVKPLKENNFKGGMDANKLVFLNVRLAIFRADPCGKRVPFFPALRPAQDGNLRWNGVFFFLVGEEES